MNSPRSNKQTRHNTLDKDRESISILKHTALSHGREEAISEPGGVKDARSSPPTGPEMERFLGLSSFMKVAMFHHPGLHSTGEGTRA
jgi:hypothetical protein